MMRKTTSRLDVSPMNTQAEPGFGAVAAQHLVQCQDLPCRLTSYSRGLSVEAGGWQPRSTASSGSLGGITSDVHAFQAAHGWIHDDAGKRMALKSLAPGFLSKKSGASGPEWGDRLSGASMCLILLNLLFMGVDMSYAMASLKAHTTKPAWIDAVEFAFAVAFIAELVVHIGLERTHFFTGPNKKWNIFDFVLGLSPLLDIVLSVTNLSFLRGVKAFRVLRAARMIKGISFVRELRLMVASILCSLVSLMWSMLLMLLMLYTFSIFLMQTIESYAKEHGFERLHEDTPKFYGTLSDCMLSLFMGISGGMDWQEMVRPLEGISRWYVLCYVVYVIFVVFGVMNILTAIFVESAGAIAEVDRDLVIQDSVARENSTINAIRSIFTAADKDGTGLLSKSMLDAQLSEGNTMAYLKVLGLDVYETRGLFKLLDIDDEDFVDIEEFVCGMMRLKGTGVNTATVMYENKRILTRLTALMRFVEEHTPMSPEEGPRGGAMQEYVLDAGGRKGWAATDAVERVISAAV